jgi:hypothetical protein
VDASSALFIVYSSDAEAGSNQFWPRFRPVSTNWGLNRLRAVAEPKPRSLRGRLWASGVETKISCGFVSRLAVSRTVATLSITESLFFFFLQVPPVLSPHPSHYYTLLLLVTEPIGSRCFGAKSQSGVHALPPSLVPILLEMKRSFKRRSKN